MAEFIISAAIAVVITAVIIGAAGFVLVWKLGVFDGRDTEEETRLALHRVRQQFEKARKEWDAATKGECSP